MRVSILVFFMFLLFCVGIISPAIAQISEIVISTETVRDFGEMSPDNVKIVDDADASNGLAIEFFGGENNPAIADPTAWIKVEFKAEAAVYFIWIRCKSDGDTGTDSLWMQFDEQIGTLEHTADKDAMARGIGNWRDVFDAGAYKWASQDVPPPTVVTVKFTEEGLHTLLMQPRQQPFLIDQILLSQDQDERPEDDPIDWDLAVDPRMGLEPEEPPVDPRAVEPQQKLTTTWGNLKKSR